MNKLALLALAGSLVTTAFPAVAADHEVKMLNRGQAGTMVFEPAGLAIEPGDTVTFVATDPGHNAETIAGMWPEGAEAIRTALGETVTITFEQPGIYGIKCTPHYAMGMVALIQVGDTPTNLEEAAAVQAPPIAARRLQAAFADLGI